MIKTKMLAVLMVSLMAVVALVPLAGEETDAASYVRTLYGVGYNGSGQQGDGTTTDVTIPTQIGTFTNVTNVVTSASYSGPYKATTFFINDGKLYGMGSNNYGQQGNGTTTDVKTPTQIGTFSNVTSVSCSSGATVFLDNGKLYGMGYNGNGQLGTGGLSNVTTPTQIGTSSTISFVVFSGDTTFYIDDGKLYGMGYNGNGQQGNGTTTDVKTPTQIGTFSNVTSVSCSSGSTFFIDSGKLYGMGYNNVGQQGDGTTTNVTTPTQIGTFSNVTSVSCSSESTFFIDSGKLYGMGRNDYGQQGNGTTTNVTTPTQIGTFSNVTSVSCSYPSTFFIDSGKLYGMGYNGDGQQGNGTTTNVTTPTQIGTFTNVSFVKNGVISGNGQGNTVFIDSGKLYGMGYNAYGQMGDGTTTNVTTPTQIGSSTDVKSASTSGIAIMFFEEISFVTVTIATNEVSYGTVSNDSVIVNAGTTISASDNILTIGTDTITATPSDSTVQYTYAFDSWTGIPNGGTITEDTAITANFTQTLTTYTITWVVGDTSTTETYEYGATPTHENPTPPEGYYFTGWNPEIATVTGDQTYTAVFSNMTVTFDPGSGTLQGDASKVVVIGQPIGELPTCTAPTNYTFDGWYTAATGGTKVTEDTIVTQEASFTLYAHYELVPALQPVKAILDVMPILIAVGLILGAVYVFMTRPELATTNNLLYAIVGISVAVLMLAVIVIPIIGNAL